MSAATLDRRLQSSVFARMLLLQACWSFERMQNLGLLYSLEPWLRRIHTEAQELREARLRHLEFFNTHPYMAGFVVGMVGGMEERLARARGPQREIMREKIRQMKNTMGSALAAIGDALFWGALRPAAAAWTLLVWALLLSCGAPHPILSGLLFFFCFYNAPVVLLRWRGINLGYSCQEELPARLKNYRWQSKIRRIRLAGLSAAIALSMIAILAKGPLDHFGRPGGFLLLGASLILRHFGMSTSKIYCAAAAVAALIELAGKL